MNILVISDAFPFPPNTGGAVRIFNLIKRISRRHRVSLITLIASSQECRFVSEMKKYCVEVETVLLKKYPKLTHLPIFIRLALSGETVYNRFYFIKEMKTRIRNTLASGHYDIIQIEHSFMAPYVTVIPEGLDCKKILTFHNIGTVLYRRMFNVEKDILKKIEYFLDWILSRRWEPKIAGQFDRCIAVSSLDKQILQSLNKKLNIAVIPNGVDVRHLTQLPPNPGSKTILMGGLLEYLPNRDSVLYFYNKILPLIDKKIKDARLAIVGKNPSRDIMKLASDRRVTVAGYVDDITAYYRECALLAVPLRAGGGTRLKILEAMALGRPVIATSLGCEGLDVTHGENILIADAPEDFAGYAVELLNNAEFRGKIAANARRLVEKQYDWDIIAEDLCDLYEGLAKNAHE